METEFFLFFDIKGLISTSVSSIHKAWSCPVVKWSDTQVILWIPDTKWSGIHMRIWINWSSQSCDQKWSRDWLDHFDWSDTKKSRIQVNLAGTWVSSFWIHTVNILKFFLCWIVSCPVLFYILREMFKCHALAGIILKLWTLYKSFCCYSQKYKMLAS